MSDLLNSIHQVLIKHKDMIFAEEKRIDDFYQMALTINQQSDEELIQSIGDPDFVNKANEFGYAEDSPIEEFLVRKLDDESLVKYSDLIESRKMIWEFPPNEMAILFKSIDVGYKELCNRIKNQFLDSQITLGVVMARSDFANKMEFTQGTTEFSSRIQEDKKERFLKSIKEYY